MRQIIPLHVRHSQPPMRRQFLQNTLPLSLYVHIPWCVKKCPYCDFNSHAKRVSLPEEAYIAALVRDLELALPLVWGRRISSIFIGGGTPSLFSGKAIKTLLTAIRTRITVLPEAEVTIEANPGSAEATRFACYREAGVTRLSLGVQSFNEHHLCALGRVHSGDEAKLAIELAATHFGNFNIDLMYGLPTQSLQEALDDLAIAVSFSPPHLSCYQLTLEPNTPFANSPPELPDADLCADMQEAIEHQLSANAYEHYEISAFAKKGYACQHNLNYWLFGDYLGIGAGAHSKLTAADGVCRQMRWKHPADYLQKIADEMPLQEEKTLTEAELPFEFMMNALRLTGGVSAQIFEMRTGLSVSTVEGILWQAQKDGLVQYSGGRICTTLHGQRFLNELLRRFLA